MPPTTIRRTCRTRSAARTYDYFYVADPLAELIADVDTVEGSGVRTHVPVAATFYPRPAALRALGIRLPSKLPTERLYWPLLPPTTDWDKAKKGCRGRMLYGSGWAEGGDGHEEAG